MNWENFSGHRPNLIETKREIASWNAGMSRPFAGMPRSTEAGYEAGMREAYRNTCDKIDKVARAPMTRESGVILGHMCSSGSICDHLNIQLYKYMLRRLILEISWCEY